VSRRKKPVTKQEALEILSGHLRNPEVEPNVFVKLAALYSRLMGWRATDAPSDDEGDAVNKLVLAAERKRRLTQ
jgi:hypothetical protein